MQSAKFIAGCIFLFLIEFISHWIVITLVLVQLFYIKKLAANTRIKYTTGVLSTV